MIQRTLVLCKPDATARRLSGEILHRLENTGLKIVAMRMLWMDEPLAKRHYAVHEGKPFYKTLVEFMTSGPIIVMALGGHGSIERWRDLMGELSLARWAISVR